MLLWNPNPGVWVWDPDYLCVFISPSKNSYAENCELWYRLAMGVLTTVVAAGYLLLLEISSLLTIVAYLCLVANHFLHAVILHFRFMCGKGSTVISETRAMWKLYFSMLAVAVK